MNFGNRQIDLLKLPNYSISLISILKPLFTHFRSPFSVLYSYLREVSPESVVLKNGMRIHLASQADIVTLVSVFCKAEYGTIPKNSTVLDIGANIGVFSVYCAISGAKRVYAFEPCRESYETLKRNITANNLENIIIPARLAICDKTTKVRFPEKSDPANRISDYGDSVEATTLDQITQSISEITILKMDCEGAEHLILPSTSLSTLEKIKHIRMEYHEKLPDIANFVITKHKQVDSYKGLVYYRHL